MQSTKPTDIINVLIIDITNTVTNLSLFPNRPPTLTSWCLAMSNITPTKPQINNELSASTIAYCKKLRINVIAVLSINPVIPKIIAETKDGTAINKSVQRTAVNQFILRASRALALYVLLT